MKKSKLTGEQIAFALRQAEVGTPVAEVCRKMGISEATYYRWKQLYGGLGPSELRKMRQLEEENQKLKRLVADLSLDKAMLQEVLAKKVWRLGGVGRSFIGCRTSSASASAAAALPCDLTGERTATDRCSPTRRHFANGSRRSPRCAFDTAIGAFTYCFDGKAGR